METRREGIIPMWKNNGRELFLGGKSMGGELFLGVKNNGREKFREGKNP